MFQRVYSLETEYALIHQAPSPEQTLPALELYERLEQTLLAQGAFAIYDSTRRAESRDEELVQPLDGYFLQHGARLYFDTGQLEWAAPESATPYQALIYDLAADRLLAQAMEQAEKQLSAGRMVIVKNNLDYMQASYGCHENYSIQLYSDGGREVKRQIIQCLLPYLVTRQILCGAGRIGLNTNPRNEPPQTPVPFQLSQRAEFITTVTEVATRNNRPIINLRDEPLADQRYFARLHLILGDSNLAQVSTFLKLGTLGLLLDMIESDARLPVVELSNPVEALWSVSCDLTFARTLALKGGGNATALALQEEYWHHAQDFVQQTYPDDPIAQGVIQIWRRMLDAIQGNEPELYTSLDWAIKYQLIDTALQKLGGDWQTMGEWDYLVAQTQNVPLTPLPGARIQEWVKSHVSPAVWPMVDEYRQQHGLDWADYPRWRKVLTQVRYLDVRYHEIDPRYGLFHRLSQMTTLADDVDIEDAMQQSPAETRAHVRTQAILLAQERNMPICMDWHFIRTSDGSREVQLPDPIANDSNVLRPLFPDWNAGADPIDPEPETEDVEIEIIDTEEWMDDEDR